MTLRAFKIKTHAEAGQRTLSRSGVWRSLEGPRPSETETPTAVQEAHDAFEAGALPPTPPPEWAAALDAIEGVHQDLQERMRTLEAEYRIKCASTIARIVSVAAPSICERAARDAISSIFDAECVEPGQRLLEITAAPDIMAIIRDECLRRSHAIKIEEDSALPPGSFRCHWPGGGLECDVGRSLFAIVEALSSPPPETC